MTEKLFTGTLRTNQPTIDINTLGRPFSIWLCVLPNLFATVILAFSVTLIRILAQLKLLLINMIAMVALEVLLHLFVRGHNISSNNIHGHHVLHRVSYHTEHLKLTGHIAFERGCMRAWVGHTFSTYSNF